MQTRSTRDILALSRDSSKGLNRMEQRDSVYLVTGAWGGEFWTRSSEVVLV